MAACEESEMLKRRTFVRGAAVGAVAGFASACGEKKSGGAAAPSERRVRWRLASSFPKGLDTIFGAADVLAKRVEALSGGRFQIRPYAAGELVPGLQVLDAVSEGAAQVGHTAGYYYTGKHPALAFDTGVPFGLSSRQQTAWLTQGGGLELVRDIYAEFGVINFPGGNTGAQMGGWFKREVNTPADLQGLRIRIPGFGGEVMSRMGATVQVLAGGDIYVALERGAIDATEWVGPYDDEKLGFHKVAKYYYYPGWWEPGPNLSFLVNKREWDQLPTIYQQIFETACVDAAVAMQAAYDHKNMLAFQRLVSSGVQLRKFSDALLDVARTTSLAYLDELAGKGDAKHKKLYESWKAFRAGSYEWFATAELAYGSYAFPKGMKS
jgi:TRAP-type mannitol/chloroaromatic compound transport system substrate-binding protein